MTELDTDITLSLPTIKPSEAEKLREVVDEKCALLSEVPGLVIEFDPEEADYAGAFREDALSEEDAQDSATDEHPYGEETQPDSKA